MYRNIAIRRKTQKEVLGLNNIHIEYSATVVFVRFFMKSVTFILISIVND